MDTFLIYIAKMAICLGAFLAIYIVFLRKTTFFRFNRWFLMLGFIASIVVPTIKYTYDIVISVPLMNAIDMSETESVVAGHKRVDISQILFMVYLLGLIFVVARNVCAYVKLSRLVKNGIKIEDRGFKLIENGSVKSPFTFLNYIILNTNKLSETEKDLILKHEITHISQRHWIDLLCSECMLVLQWFNPFAWMYVRLLKENHEYLADKAVIDSGISPTLYQAVLINQEFQGPVFSFSNSFNYSKPLNRLSMIKKAKSASWKRITALFIIPVFGLFIWASAEPRYIMEYSMEPITKDTVRQVTYSIDIKNGENISGKDTTYIISIGDSITLSGKKIITNSVPVKAIYKYDIDQNNDSDVKSKGTFIVYNADQKDTLKGKPHFFIRGISSDKKPLIILDGVEISDFGNTPPESIESVSILKDKAAIDVYGDKGKNGVVIVETKKGKQDNMKTTSKLDVVHVKDSTDSRLYFLRTTLSNFNSDDKPIFIVDGEKVADINALDINTIKSFEIFKDKAFIDKYGDEGKNGVILITTKSKKNNK
ncbi:MAG: M56 family metallopeptidase [Dysgonomonas sp.]